MVREISMIIRYTIEYDLVTVRNTHNLQGQKASYGSKSLIEEHANN